MQRIENLESAALNIFEETAKKSGFTTFKGQGSDNRLPLGGNLYYQFGDLRVDTKSNHIVIEVESAGGVTNLVKYWYYLSHKSLSKGLVKPIILLHIYRQTSVGDYGSHLALWDFLWSEMKQSIGDRIQAKRYLYRETSDLEPAVNFFEKSIFLR